MKTKVIELWVGFFVTLGILSLLILALQVSGLGNFYSGNSGYTVKAAFEHIGGLKARSKVTIAGVTVGRVSKINLEIDEYGSYKSVVSLVINIKYNKIPDDSEISILTAGLLGDNYIGITPGHSEEYFVDGVYTDITKQALLLEDLISKFAVGG